MKKTTKETIGAVIAIGVVLTPVVIAGVAMHKQNKQTKENLAKLKAYKHKHGLDDSLLRENINFSIEEAAYTNDQIEWAEGRAIMAETLTTASKKVTEAKTIESFETAWANFRHLCALVQEDKMAAEAIIFEAKSKKAEDKEAAQAKKEQENLLSERKFELDKMAAIGSAVANLAKSVKPDPIQVVNNIGKTIGEVLKEKEEKA